MLMKNQRTKNVVFTATVFTAILLGCAVYVGAYPVPSAKVSTPAASAAFPDKEYS